MYEFVTIVKFVKSTSVSCHSLRSPCWIGDPIDDRFTAAPKIFMMTFAEEKMDERMVSGGSWSSCGNDDVDKGVT